MMRKRRLFLILGGAASAVTLGFSAAVAFSPLDGGAGDDRPPLRTIQVGAGRATSKEAADVASRDLGFRVRVPTAFATSATEMALIAYDNNTPLPVKSATLRFKSAVTKRTPSGFEYQDTVDILQRGPGAEIIPGGDPFPVPVPGAQVWKEAVAAHPQVVGQPQRFTYHVILPGGVTYIMGFTGEQPTPEGRAKMLQSMR